MTSWPLRAHLYADVAGYLHFWVYQEVHLLYSVDLINKNLVHTTEDLALRKKLVRNVHTLKRAISRKNI